MGGDEPGGADQTEPDGLTPGERSVFAETKQAQLRLKIPEARIDAVVEFHGRTSW